MIARVVSGDELRAVMQRVPAAVAVVTVETEGRSVGLTVASLVSLSLEPPLVGFAIRRDAALHELLGREIERAARGATEPPSLVLIDLDHFKQVNELHGHLTGDEVLRRVGSALRSGIRPYDVAARYGGDEFALIVTAAEEEAAEEIAARAVDRIAAAIAEFIEGDAAGATAGVATWEPGIGASDLVARADRALRRRRPSPRCSGDRSSAARRPRPACRSATARTTLRSGP